MGKGDKKTRRGKIFAGSYGKTRPRPKGQTIVTSEPKPIAEKPAKKRTPRVVKSAPAPESQAEETAAAVPTLEENAPETTGAETPPESNETPAVETRAAEPEAPTEEHPAAEAAPEAEAPTEEAKAAE